MFRPRYGSAVLYVYDINHILASLEPILIEWVAYCDHTRGIYEETIIDLWISTTIHDFQMASVDNLHLTRYPAELINALRSGHGSELAMHGLWDLFKHARENPTLAGSVVIVKRSDKTLYVVYHFPDRLTII